MAALVDRSRLETKLAGFSAGPSAALTDPSLWAKAQEYRRMTAARMTALSKDEIKTKLPAGEYHLSRKVDGEFNLLAFDGKDALLVNPGGTVRVGLPLLEEAVKMLRKDGVEKVLAAGELHYRRPDGTRERVHDVSRVARQPSSPDELAGLHFAVFDLLELDSKPVVGAFGETWKRIEKLFKGGRQVAPVEALAVKDIAEVQKQFDQWVEGEGAEGLVLRSDVAGSFKVKPRRSLDCVVVGFTEGVDDRAGMLHDALIALMREEGTFHILGRVGGGFSEDERRGFLSDLKDMAVESDYAEVNPEHVAYRMVKPEWIFEISVLDLISQTTRGASIDRMVLNWDGQAGRYQSLRRLPLASPISPQFVRRREDKVVRPADLRLAQVAERVEVPYADRDARTLTLPKSQILKREVYTKVLKGNTMVRKLLLWKTNKEHEGSVGGLPKYPAFVVHYTDFSPNRKDPLANEIRVSDSQAQIEALYGELLKEATGRGWNKA